MANRYRLIFSPIRECPQGWTVELRGTIAAEPPAG